MILIQNKTTLFDSLRPSDIYVSINYGTIGLDNGLSPGRRQVIIWTNVGLLSIRTLGINSIEIVIEFQTVSFKNKL